MKKFLFILNPVSGKGKGIKLLNSIRQYLSSENISYDLILTEKPNHATELVKIYENNFKYIISVGGDGTLNEVVNGYNFKNGTIFGVLPVGSGNDFAQNLGLKKDLIDNLKLICLDKHEVKECDICEITYFDKTQNSEVKKRFINNLGLGFDAQVAFINQNNKIFSGIISYVFAVLRAMKNYKSINFTLKLKDSIINGEKLLLTFGNGVSSGGGFYLTPHAQINDNMLAVTTIDFIKRTKLLRKLPLALINKIETVKEAKLYKTESADIHLNNFVYIHTDGESRYIHTDKINVSVMKEKIKFITRV